MGMAAQVEVALDLLQTLLELTMGAALALEGGEVDRGQRLLALREPLFEEASGIFARLRVPASSLPRARGRVQLRSADRDRLEARSAELAAVEARVIERLAALQDAATPSDRIDAEKPRSAGGTFPRIRIDLRA